MMTAVANESVVRKEPWLRFELFQGAWKSCRLNEAALVYDGTHQTPEYVAAGVPFVSVENISDLDKTEKFITEEAFEKDFKQKPQVGDILMTRITAGVIGDTAIVSTNDPLAYYVSLALIRTKGNTLPEFLSCQINSPYFRHELHKRIIHVAFPKKINLGDLGECVVSLPTLPEQTKIAGFLRAVDAKIQQLARKKALLEQYKKGVMQQLFSQKLRFKREDGTHYPDWEKRPMSSFLVERNVKAPKSDRYPLMSFVAYKGVTPKVDRYDREFLVNNGTGKLYKQTELGDFIYSSNNLETGSIGLNNLGSASISPVYSIFRMKESCHPQFISEYLVRRSFLDKMVMYRQGVVYGQWRIHESDFLSIQEKMPCLEEQQRIAGFLSALDGRVAAVQQQLAGAVRWKKGLLQQMFV